jgi:glycosyltransferase involved in cell wall biosynthesis
MEAPRPRYSVVITVHNDREGMSACLAALLAEPECISGDAEVIVVDDRSDDGSGEVAAASGIASLRLFRIEEKLPGPLTARQEALDLGIRAARGAIVLILESDAVVTPGWIACLSGPIEKGIADAVAGPIRFRPAGKPVARLQAADACFYLTICRLVAFCGGAPGIYFMNFAFHSALYRQCGGFQRIGMRLTEDLAFARAIHRIGARIAFPSEPSVEVQACKNWGALLKRGRRVSSGEPSVLAAVLVAWVLSAPILGIALVISHKLVFATLFAFRIAAGAALITSAAHRYRIRSLGIFPYCYDFVAVAAGIWIAVSLYRDPSIEWGGVSYE